MDGGEQRSVDYASRNQREWRGAGEGDRGRNPGPARSGTATIAGRTLTVNQAVAACSYKVSPLEIKVDEDRAAREDRGRDDVAPAAGRR